MSSGLRLSGALIGITRIVGSADGKLPVGMLPPHISIAPATAVAPWFRKLSCNLLHAALRLWRMRECARERTNKTGNGNC